VKAGGDIEKTLEKEVDFEVVEEPWVRYRLKDGTIIRLRLPVLKMFESVRKGPMGYPNFRMRSHAVVSATVPEDLKGDPSPNQEIRPEDIVEESKIIQRLEDKWQKYGTEDGWMVKVRPVVRKIFRSNKFNDDRESIYSVDWEVLTDVEKAEENK
jgi:hypothetical protein